jgi:hypothetical protein
VTETLLWDFRQISTSRIIVHIKAIHSKLVNTITHCKVRTLAMAKKTQSPAVKRAAKPANSTPTKALDAKGKKPIKPAKVAEVVEAKDGEDEHEDYEDYEDVPSDLDSDDEDETDGVTEEGMQRLMELLGKDGLNEFDMDVLSCVAGGEDDDELEYGSGDGSQMSDEEDDEEDEEEGDEDVVPASVRIPLRFISLQAANLCSSTRCSNPTCLE